MSQTTITITTIHKPTFIEDLCRNIGQFEHGKDTDILIIGDLKTPPIKDYCKKVSKKFNVPIQYWDIESQEKSFSDMQSLLDLFPYNTPDRVILGGMLAYFRVTDRIIALDDDNFVTENDFVGYHSITGTDIKYVPLGKNDFGWFNVHRTLDEAQGIPFYPRGYPISKRVEQANDAIFERKPTKVIVNQGLVLGDPDIDAMQRLVNPIQSTSYKSHLPPQFGLYKTWSPFNYQNTSLCRELIPCYFRPKSGLRNADIWTAYLFNKLAEHFDDTITFGQPLVKQVRNEHNLFDDLDVELENNKETDYFVDLLKSIHLDSYKKDISYFTLLDEFVSYIGETLIFDDKVKDNPMIASFVKEYRIWIDTVGSLC